MEFVILDLEWNNSHQRGRKKPINEIIEFGAVKVDENMNKLSEFSVLVKPKIGRYVSGRTRRLTHLTIKMLKESGVPFEEALEMFKKFLGNAVLMSWGTSDITTLMDNNEYYYGTKILDYIASYVNVQNYCQDMLDCADPAHQIGLSAAADMLNIDQNDVEHHRALDDSLLTFECFKRLYDVQKIKPYIEDASCKSFYERLSYKTVSLVDIDNPVIDKKEMYFICDSCGVRMLRKNKWVVKNKSFRADFYCPKCKRLLSGRIQFKLKYDGMEIIKKLVPIVRNEDDNPKEEN